MPSLAQQISQKFADGLLNGWRPDPEYAARSQAANPYKTMAQAAPHLYRDGERETFLWRFLWAVLREIDSNYVWRPQYQKYGTCVGQGWKLAMDTSLAVQYAIGRKDGRKTKFPGRVSVASMYAGGRVESAHQPGRWEGSNGYWVRDFVLKYGVGLLKDIGLPEDARDEDENIAMDWTASRDGIPQKFEDLCKTRPVRSAVRVTNFQEAAVAIQNGVAVTECSGLIPGGKLDKDGFFTSMGRGGHCELFWAVRYDKRGLWMQNSWDTNSGATQNNQTYPGDSPSGGGWVKEQWVNDILGQDDSHAASDVDGIPSRNMDDYAYSEFLN